MMMSLLSISGSICRSAAIVRSLPTVNGASVASAVISGVASWDLTLPATFSKSVNSMNTNRRDPVAESVFVMHDSHQTSAYEDTSNRLVAGKRKLKKSCLDHKFQT